MPAIVLSPGPTPIHPTLATAVAFLLAACGSGSDAVGSWSGTVDTLPSGEIAVHNADDPLWTPEETWQVVEDLRIGQAMSEGPDLFGSIWSFDVDAWGRIFILDDQAQEVRVFDSEGAFVRTVGRKGEGPGEFTQAGSVDLSRDGEIWVMGLGQGRVSIFDTAGTFLRQQRTDGGFVVKPYPGGFDPMGRYNVLIPTGGMRTMARFDQSFTPIDTISLPEDPTEGEFFENVSEDGSSTMRAGVPFQEYMTWRFSPTGTVWTLLTGRYQLTEMTIDGKVLRTITKDHEPIPVTDEERDQAVERLEWFTSQGGQIDRSKFPGSKPSTVSFFIDDDRNIWVERQVPATEEDDVGRLFDLFDGDGRYLGMLRLPFELNYSIPVPIVREGMLYGATYDEIGVLYVVRARIVKP